MKNLLCLVVLLFSLQTKSKEGVFSLACGGVCQDDVHISVESYHDLAYFSDRPDEFEEENILPLASRISVKMNRGAHRVDFDDAIETFRLNRSNPKWLLGFTVTTRFDPIIVKDFVKNHAEDLLESEIIAARKENTGFIKSEVASAVADGVEEERRSGIQETRYEQKKSLYDLDLELERQRQVFLQKIPLQVDQAIAKNPEIQRIPEPYRSEQIAALREEMIKDSISNMDEELRSESVRLRNLIQSEANKAIAEINDTAATEKKRITKEETDKALQQLEEELAEEQAKYAQMIKSRTDKVTEEQKLNRLAVGLGRVLRDGKGMIYARFGKIQVNHGFSRDVNGQSLLERISGLYSFAERAGGTENTLGFNLGAVIALNQTTFATVEMYTFHNRIGSVSASDYLANQLAMSDEDFSKFNNYDNLDSWLFRAAIETRKKGANLNAFVSVGQYAGAEALNVGGRVSLENGLSLSGSYYRGERYYATEAFMFQVDYQYRDRLTAFYRFELAEDIHFEGEKYSTMIRHLIGLKFKIYDNCAAYPSGCVQAHGKVYLERNELFQDDQSISGKWEAGAGAELRVFFN